METCSTSLGGNTIRGFSHPAEIGPDTSCDSSSCGLRGGCNSQTTLANTLPIAGFVQFRHLPEQFFPPTDSNQFQIELELPPQAFTPPPKVHSAVVHLTALAEPRFPADARVLQRVVAKAFNQRRKMLRASLKGLAPELEDRLISAGIAPTDRAENVTLEQFCALARMVGS